MNLSRNHRIHLLSVVLCLVFSTAISQFSFQEDDEAPRMCPDIGPFEHHIDACLQNRILQLNDVAELTDSQTKRLRVIAKGVMKRVTQDDDGIFLLRKPTQVEVLDFELGSCGSARIKSQKRKSSMRRLTQTASKQNLSTVVQQMRLLFEPTLSRPTYRSICT